MQIKNIKVGSLQTNCYILIDETSQDAVIIDPGDEANLLLPAIQGLKISYIIITHGHPDHFGAMEALQKQTGAKVLMHATDNWFFTPHQTINEGDKIKFGTIVLEVLHTPGHSGGSTCLYTPGHLFSGDTLFFQTWGRTDLPGGSEETMQKSLSRLARLPDDTIVYPGHGRPTTVGQEKEFGTLAG